MATIRPITAQRSIDTGSIPGTQIDDSVGQGLRAAGSALAGLGSTLHEIDMRRERMKNQADEFRADQASRRLEDDNALLFDQTRQDIDPSGEGFTATISKQLTQRYDEFIKTVPVNLRPKFAELATTAREEWLNKASRAEIDQRNTWYRDGIQKTLEGRQTQVFNDPSLFDAAKSDGYRAIDASGLPETEKKKLKEAWDETLAVTIGEREIRDAEADPASAKQAAHRLGVAGASPVEQVVSRIIGAESGGDPNAKNPKSSASGVGQFTNGTWLATIKKHRPDIASGRSDKEILSLKNDARLGREMTTRLTEDNARDLAAAGVPVTAGTLYLAHFAGIGGARAVLRANPSASLSDILDPAAMKANGFLNGKTAGWLISWADGKMKGGATPQAPSDPRYASLSLDKRLEIYDRTQAAARRGQTALDAQAKAEYQSMKGSMELGIQTGDLSSPQQIMSSGLSDADKADMLSALRTRQGDAMATAEAVSLFSAGNLRVDPYDSKGRKTVDNAWTAVSQAVPPEQLQASAEEMVRQTGVVPQSVVNNIRQGLTSKDVDAVMQAAQMAQRLSTVDPAALGRRDGGGEAQKAADDFGFYVNRLNLSPEDAARRLAENRDPEKQRDRKAIEPAAKEFIKGLQDFDLASQFDDSFLGLSSNPSLGLTPSQELGIKADFLAIAEDEFYRANGDPDLAQNRAVEQMKRLYGVTEFGGVKAVVKHPPENYWPKSTLGTSVPSSITGGAPVADAENISGRTPTLDYARRQLEADVSGMGLNADPATIQLVTTPETDAMVKRGELPAYGILFKDKDGMYQTIPGKLWRPDISEAVKVQQKADQEATDAAVEFARGQQEIERVKAVEQGDDGGRASSLDAFVDGPVKPPKPVPEKRETPANQVQQQRSQLFKDAQDAGTLSPQGALSGADDVFGAR